MDPDKTKLLVIGVPQLLRQLPDFTITLCGKPISSTPVAKDLGVFLDQCLSYDEHIRKTVASCIKKLIQINRIKHLHARERFCWSFIALFLAGCFTASPFGAIPRQLTSISFSLFKIFSQAYLGTSQISPVNLGIFEAKHQTNCNRIVFNAI